MEVSTRVQAPAEVVWGVVTDLAGSADVISAIDRVEVLAGGDPFGVGTRWRETRTMFGRESTEEMAVTAVDPGRSYTIEADSRGAHYRSTMRVTGVSDDETLLEMTFDAEPTGAISKFFSMTLGKAFESGTRKALEQDLADIAAAARARAGN